MPLLFSIAPFMQLLIRPVYKGKSLRRCLQSNQIAARGILGGMGCSFSSGAKKSADNDQYPVVCAESVMNQKGHGSCSRPVMSQLRWGCDYETADRICCYNRHYAERSGYFESTTFLKEVDHSQETTFYDSVTGKPLFIAPKGRSFRAFLIESKNHGWPSFRDEEVVWENVRCLENGETVSLDGTHLGHNLPDGKGNRYCINLVSVAGRGARDEGSSNSI